LEFIFIKKTLSIVIPHLEFSLFISKCTRVNYKEVKNVKSSGFDAAALFLFYCKIRICSS